MESTEKTIDVLNDLIKINNDRVAGFEKASEDLKEDQDGLRPIFGKLADESRENSAELTSLANQYGEEAVDGTSASGSLHRAWIDIKSAFGGTDQKSILEECERGEDAIKSAYHSALDDSDEISSAVLPVINRQLQGIMEGHDLIKSLRDESEDFDETDEVEDDELTTTGPVDVGDYEPRSTTENENNTSFTNRNNELR